MNPSEQPFFIVGVHRSGTTLLRYMLSSSPRIYIPPESDFIPRFFLKRPSHHLDEEQVEKILNFIFTRYRFVKEWEGEAPQAALFFEQRNPQTAAGFLDHLYRSYAEQKGAVRWGDKTPIYSSYIDLIHQIFPQAKFIHIIRDGRDVALSILDKWGDKEFHVDIYFAARNWVRRIRQGQASGKRIGSDLFYELHYESLVDEPERELRAICDFLDEPFVEEMVTHHRQASQQIESGSFHDAVRQPANKSRIGRWREEMSPADLRLFERIAAPLLTELGYKTASDGTMPITEKARFQALHLKYETLQFGRSLAQRAGLVPPI
ncbi:MAG: sulfotransferase [Candidatus Promineifilaceae bacterium]